MDKQNVVYLDNELGLKKEWSIDTCNNINEPQKLCKWTKANTKNVA